MTFTHMRSNIANSLRLGVACGKSGKAARPRRCVVEKDWLGGRDSNPDTQIQNLQSYRWTTSQQGGNCTHHLSNEHLLLQLAAHDGVIQPSEKALAQRLR